MERITHRSLLITGMVVLAVAARTPEHLVAQASPPQYTAHPSTQTPERLVTREKLEEIQKEVSNWGRWTNDP